MMDGCRMYTLEYKGDERGWLYSLPAESLLFLGEVNEMHLGAIEPDAIRGNHFHPNRKEVLLVQHQTQWEFLWQFPDEDEPHVESILGHGGVVIEILPGVVHTLRNTGTHSLIMAAFSNRAYVPDSDDTQRLILV